jgi:hypothetical protein
MQQVGVEPGTLFHATGIDPLLFVKLFIITLKCEWFYSLQFDFA